MTAHVLWWNLDRGHGFARAADEDVFVHHAALVDGGNLREGQEIEFDAVPGTVGTVAANVRVL